MDKKVALILASKMLGKGYGQVAARRDYLGYVNGSELSYDRKVMEALDSRMTTGGVKTLWEGDELYPRGLRSLDDPPFLLFYRGSLDRLDHPSITVVGTRKFSIYGSSLVDHLVDVISEHFNKSCISTALISGMAYGIDRRVHICSLERSLPTISVVAGGLDSGFPRMNSGLVDQVAREGLLISEFPPGTEVIKGMFPMRNRLMAALGDVTVVIESPVKSGSLITARQALDLGKEVYAFPGDIFRESSKGTNSLIRDGAFPLTSKFDILDMLNGLDR